MGLRILPTTASMMEVVFSDDPDVTLKDEALKGWVPKEEADIQPGADVVTVRPLNVDERMETGDVNGLRQSMLARCRKGITAVNGDNSKTARRDFLEGCPTAALFLLGCFITAITSADDPQASQRAFFGAEGDDA